jgi:hypothetical protein
MWEQYAELGCTKHLRFAGVFPFEKYCTNKEWLLLNLYREQFR